MQFIKPNFEVLLQDNTLEGVYKQIEIAGRTCYKSTEKISENSAEKFVQRMIDSNHGGMLEHGTIYLHIQYGSPIKDINYFKSVELHARYLKNKYSTVKRILSEDNKINIYVTTNYRVLVENGWLNDLKYMCEPTEHHEKRVTIRFHMDRIGTQSCTRHRTMSFAQESTRFVNYNKDKFGNEINISIPSWTNEEEINNAYDKKYFMLDVYYKFLNEKYNERVPQDRYPIEAIYYWIAANEFAEWCYMKLIGCGLNAEQARAVLPCDIDSEIIITASINDWKHFFNLRYFGTTGKPHPDIKEIATGLYNKFLELKYITE